MTEGKHGFKIIFGFVIFLFSCAFAFFTAQWLNADTQGAAYSLTLFVFGVAYILVATATGQIMAVSLGFLFSADVVLLYLLASDFSGFASWAKVFIVGATLVVLYVYAWHKLKDEDQGPQTPFIAPQP
ncbi:MAG: hypothetical protein Q8R08_02125 [bacterium]|nr:hypothetical protein [bacterium]